MTSHPKMAPATPANDPVIQPAAKPAEPKQAEAPAQPAPPEETKKG